MAAAAAALAEVIVGLVRAHRLDQWARLCFAMIWSYCTAFSFATGSALLAHQAAAAAIGAGMVSGAGAALFLFVRSPLTKNLMIAVPRELIRESETDQHLATIQR